MFKHIIFSFLFFCSPVLFFCLQEEDVSKTVETGQLSIYFMEEKVGFEEYEWQINEKGYVLESSGRMTKPFPLEISKLEIYLNKSFIPEKFLLRGSIRGREQYISSDISEGSVKNFIKISGQENRTEARIRRDSLLLPNAVFSPYLVVAKKYRCALQEKLDLSAYIIPQLEASITLEPKEDSPCHLIMNMHGIEIELETNERGEILSISIPSQRIRVVKDD